MPRNTVSDRLLQAKESCSLVTIGRSIRKTDKEIGFVVGMGRDWVVVHAASDHQFLNGYVALRKADICAVKRHEAHSFQVRALTALGETPVVPTELDLSSTEALVTSMALLSPLLTIFTERQFPDECYIGRLRAITKMELRLLEIDPQAKWHDAESSWPVRDITRIDIGARYEKALYLVGGEPPDNPA